MACGATTPHCSGAVCVAAPSCQFIASGCGPALNENCCSSTVVPGGTFNRSNMASYPATVSDFRLDKFEVSVGRFRQFVSAVVGGWKPAAGAGKHAHLNAGSGIAVSTGVFEPGWDTGWSAELPQSKAAWDTALACEAAAQTWTPSQSTGESFPINCISWYQAYAFCIWDGGFLPTETESNYAAAGGNEQRIFAWGANPVDDTYAVYCGSACLPLATGSKLPKGAGRWGHADLSGNVAEWALDYANPFPMPCANCASLTVNLQRRARNGFFHLSASNQLTSVGSSFVPASSGSIIGVRCARMP